MRKIDIFDAVTDAVLAAGVDGDMVDTCTAGRLLVLSARGGARVECGAWFADPHEAMRQFTEIAHMSGLKIMNHDDAAALWRACNGWLSEVAWIDGFKKVDSLAAAHDAVAGVTLIALDGKLKF